MRLNRSHKRDFPIRGQASNYLEVRTSPSERESGLVPNVCFGVGVRSVMVINGNVPVFAALGSKMLSLLVPPSFLRSDFAMSDPRS
jgi:hypothetical protein